MTPHKIAAILGRFLSLLPAMPALRAFTELLVQFVRQADTVGLDIPSTIAQESKDQVHVITGLLREWPGRKFVTSREPAHKHLASDATLLAWGGLNVRDPQQILHLFWRFTAHIADKQLMDAINTTQSPAKPSKIVALDVDNAIVYAYLTNHALALQEFHASSN